MAGPKPETYSPTGKQIYRMMLRRGWDRRRLARALFGDEAAQKKLTDYFRRNHTAPTLLEAAEIFGCAASELLPECFFDPELAKSASEKAI